MRRLIPLLLLAGATAGCPFVPPETGFRHMEVKEPTTGTKYLIYVPSYYSEDRDWPLVVTLHGTNPWDTRIRQILDWKDTAELNGLIVVAPSLKSTQGFGPFIPTVTFAYEKDLIRDEKVTLAVIDHVRGKYRIARRRTERKPPGGKGKLAVVEKDLVLLTGFSSGGYPLYYIGLRHPDRFDMLIARDCNSSQGIFRRINLTEEARNLPIVIIWAKDDPQAIQDQSWAAFEFLRLNRCYGARREVIRGGHWGWPGVAYETWASRLPKEYRK